MMHRYNRPRLLTAMIESVTCRSKSKMAAIQGKNIRSDIGKTLFFNFASTLCFRSPSTDIFWQQLFIAELLVVIWTVLDRLMENYRSSKFLRKYRHFDTGQLVGFTGIYKDDFWLLRSNTYTFKYLAADWTVWDEL